MARLRYVKDLSASPKRTKTHHTVQSIRALYDTDPEIVAALLPRPLEAASSPTIFVQFANIAMHLSEERTMRLGAATVGVACTHEGEAGYYVLAMPMEGELAVVAGREKFGEPKKIAETEFSADDERVSAKVTRHGITFLELEGELGAASEGPLEFEEHFYCYKALPACEPEKNENGGFDGEVFLTRLEWEREYTSLRKVHDGRIILRESPWDPLVDVPVRRLSKMEFAEGGSRTGGKVLRTVPGEWLAPYLVQRYDEPQPGIEVLVRPARPRASS